VPGVARLVQGDPYEATIEASAQAGFTPAVSIATLTAEPKDTPLPPTATQTASATPSPVPATRTPTSVPASTSLTATPTLPPSTPTSPPPPTPTPPPPSPTPRSSWLAFETRRGQLGDYEIFAIAPDGSGLTDVTQSWADDLAPVWSADGRWIAFVSLRDTLTGKWDLEKGSIYITEFDLVRGVSLGNVRRVTDSTASDGWPTWSPDGKRIAFHSKRNGNWDIWVINIDGTGLARLTQHAAPDRYPSWSPDGQQIAFTSKRSGNEDIWVLDVDAALAGTGDSQAVNLSQSPSPDRYSMWSPDGRQLAFNTMRDGDYEAYIMGADGSNPRNVSNSPDTTEGLADWSPDGKSLVLYSDRPGNKDVFVIDLATGRWTNVTKHPASDEFCTWSP
jgi:Tol biopolymer transport system component